MLEWMPRPPNATGLLRHYTRGGIRLAATEPTKQKTGEGPAEEGGSDGRWSPGRRRHPSPDLERQ
jgi:hypothetical protein